MERAPAGVGIVFGVSLAVLIVLVGPLLLFNPWTTSALQERHDVADALGVTRDQVDRATGSILADLVTDGSFAVGIEGQPLLDERERSHMHDVAVLVRTLAAVAILAAVLAGVTGAWLRRERHRVGRVMVVAAGTVGMPSGCSWPASSRSRSSLPSSPFMSSSSRPGPTCSSPGRGSSRSSRRASGSMPRSSPASP